MAKKKLQENAPSSESQAGTRRRSGGIVTEASDRSPATQTASTTSEEVLASVRNADTASMPAGPSHDDIAAMAYQRYVERGGSHGNDLADWIEAERELSKRRGG